MWFGDETLYLSRKRNLAVIRHRRMRAGTVKTILITVVVTSYTDGFEGINSRKINNMNPSRRNNSLDNIFSMVGGGNIKQKSDVSILDKKGGSSPRLPPMNIIRLLFLTFYASLGSLLPYLPVYYHSLGHNGMSIGLLGAVKPLTTFIVAPAWGILSDSSDSLHSILQFTLLSGLFFQLALALNDGLMWLMTTVFLTSIMNAPIKSLMDCMVMNTLPSEKKGEYGKLRLWGQLGFGLGSSGVGMLLNRIPTSTEMKLYTKRGDMWESIRGFWWQITHGYKLAFVSHALISIPVFFFMKVLQKLQEEGNSQTSSSPKPRNKTNILKGLNLLMHDSDAIFFLFLVFVIGVSSGIIENFAYVRMREVGGTGFHMGISRLVSSAAGVPMFWFSSQICNKFGVDKILCVSLLIYAIRFFIYAFMRHPMEGLTAEAMRGCTFAVFWSTSTVYAHKISPKGMAATMLMFLNAMYGGLGQSLGAIIGGKMQMLFGTVNTFRVAGIFDLIFSFFVSIYLHFGRNTNTDRKSVV